MADAALDKCKEQYEELTRYIAAHLLGTDDFKVTSKVKGSQILLTLEAPADVRGRVIGRGGRIARAMRQVLDAAAIPTHLRPSLDIAD